LASVVSTYETIPYEELLRSKKYLKGDEKGTPFIFTVLNKYLFGASIVISPAL
jgi:hypothetical protein